MSATKKMSHPDAGRAVEVPAGEVPLYESQGWSVKDAPASKSAPSKPAPVTK